MDGEGADARRDERRKAILQAAGEVFYEEGFAAASMSQICARLGGSKGTLYNYFENKEELFEAVIADRCRWFSESIFRIVDEDLPVREVLLRVGETFLEQLQDPVIRLIQLVIGEAQRLPQVAKVFYEFGPEASARRLAHHLEAAKARGEIDVHDCQAAAHRFMSLCRGDLYFRRLLNQVPAPDHAHAQAEIEAVVDMFLATCGKGGEEG